MKRRPRVALVIETSGVYGRQILRGIGRYLDTHRNWSVFVDEGDTMNAVPEWLVDWDGDGIICRSTTPALAQALKRTGITVVDLNDTHGFLDLPFVGSDMPAIGRLATEHLLERGLHNIAFAGFDDQAWSLGRLKGIEEAMTHRGNLCGVFETNSKSYRTRAWQSELDLLCDWVESLPKPVGIVACNDRRGQHVLEACRMLDLSVPDEVSVVGVDNALIICELCYPRLSSVMPNAEAIGFEAASLLARLMSEPSQDSPAERILIPPRGVVTRPSSDAWVMGDPVFAKAIRFVREHAAEGATVEDVRRHTKTSRSTLERIFRQHLGHSPQEELRALRLMRVKELLRETELSIAQIADVTGFKEPAYLSAQFKRVVGQTVTQWREKDI